MPRDLPTGVVTFMFTDIEGSTRLVHELGDRYGDVLADQRRILREVWKRWRGVERSTEGDSFFVVFRAPIDAVAAAAEAQRRLAEHEWPDGRRIRVRMGMHTGPTLVVDEDYFGIEVNRAARIAGTSHGGQVVLSRATMELLNPLPVGLALKDLGEHRLKDIAQPEWLFQLTGEGLDAEFPPLRSLETPINLPHPATSLIGRSAELDELARAPRTQRSAAGDAHRAGWFGEDAPRYRGRLAGSRAIRERCHLRAPCLRLGSCRCPPDDRAVRRR